MIDEKTEAFFAALQKLSSKDVLFVGIGNTLKADDGVGPATCSLLKEVFPNSVIDTGMVPENYIQVIIKKNPKVILIIDAIDFDAPLGTIKVFETAELSTGGITTHTLSPRLLSDMIAKSIPAKIYFVGIQPKSMMIGHPMSQEVDSAKKELLEIFKHLFSFNTI